MHPRQPSLAKCTHLQGEWPLPTVGPGTVQGSLAFPAHTQELGDPAPGASPEPEGPSYVETVRTPFLLGPLREHNANPRQKMVGPAYLRDSTSTVAKTLPVSFLSFWGWPASIAPSNKASLYGLGAPLRGRPSRPQHSPLDALRVIETVRA